LVTEFSDDFFNFSISFFTAVLTSVKSTLSSGLLGPETHALIVEISKCKFYFCSRASVYENFSKNLFDVNFKEGRFAGRVSEAIICGCIPLYWQPEVSNSYLTPIKQKFLYSRKKFIPSNWGTKGNLKSLPYDKMDKKLKKGIEIVEDVNDAFKKVTQFNKVQIKNKLKYGRKIYKKYISPNSFYKFIKANLND